MTPAERWERIAEQHDRRADAEEARTDTFKKNETVMYWRNLAESARTTAKLLRDKEG